MENTTLSEIWKDIKGYEGSYQISSLGRVRSLERVDSIGRHVSEKILKPSLEEWGYFCYCLYKDAEQQFYKAHRLVAQAFIPNPSNRPEVNHIDGDKTNNRVSNLEWVTGSENVKHAYDNKLHKKPTGENNPNATLNWKIVKWIRENYKRRSPMFGAKALSKRFGVEPQTISLIVRNKIWKEEDGRV